MKPRVDYSLISSLLGWEPAILGVSPLIAASLQYPPLVSIHSIFSKCFAVSVSLLFIHRFARVGHNLATNRKPDELGMVLKMVSVQARGTKTLPL